MTDFDICNCRKARTVLVLPIMVGIFTLSACQQLELINPFPRPTAEAEAAAEPPPPRISAVPIKMSERDISFAQAALNSLGYKVGEVDGLWGPRSERAIRSFEQDQNLVSANGRLSELNLTTLERISRIRRRSLPAPKSGTTKGIAAKLDPTILRQQKVPQLIITEQPYPILLRANPFSEVITTLPPGTGLYILNLQSGWYEVESTDNLRGFIKAE